MQESTQVAWGPTIVDRTTPWELKVYILYLFIVFVISVARSLSVGRQLWFLGRIKWAQRTNGNREKAESAPQKDPMPVGCSEKEFLYRWEICSVKVASMKRAMLLTLLLSVLLCILLAARFFTGMSMEKSTRTAMVAGTIAEVLYPLALGIAVSAAFYCMSSFYEGVLARRKAYWNFRCSTREGQASLPPPIM